MLSAYLFIYWNIKRTQLHELIIVIIIQGIRKDSYQ